MNSHIQKLFLPLLVAIPAFFTLTGTRGGAAEDPTAPAKETPTAPVADVSSEAAKLKALIDEYEGKNKGANTPAQPAASGVELGAPADANSAVPEVSAPTTRNPVPAAEMKISPQPEIIEDPVTGGANKLIKIEDQPIATPKAPAPAAVEPPAPKAPASDVVEPPAPLVIQDKTTPQDVPAEMAKKETGDEIKEAVKSDKSEKPEQTEKTDPVSPPAITKADQTPETPAPAAASENKIEQKADKPKSSAAKPKAASATATKVVEAEAATTPAAGAEDAKPQAKAKALTKKWSLFQRKGSIFRQSSQ